MGGKIYNMINFLGRKKQYSDVRKNIFVYIFKSMEKNTAG